MSTLKENLVMLRKSCDLTQEDLAKHLNLSRQAYSKYEQGTAEPSIGILINLADFFNISLDELVGRKLKQDIQAMKDMLVVKQINTDFKNIVSDVIKELVDEKENDIKNTVLKRLGFTTIIMR